VQLLPYATAHEGPDQHANRAANTGTINVTDHASIGGSVCKPCGITYSVSNIRTVSCTHRVAHKRANVGANRRSNTHAIDGTDSGTDYFTNCDSYSVAHRVYHTRAHCFADCIAFGDPHRGTVICAHSVTHNVSHIGSYG
jgi:hypothetical protein